MATLKGSARLNALATAPKETAASGIKRLQALTTPTTPAPLRGSAARSSADSPIVSLTASNPWRNATPTALPTPPKAIEPPKIADPVKSAGLGISSGVKLGTGGSFNTLETLSNLLTNKASKSTGVGRIQVISNIKRIARHPNRTI